jgi:hypothetical protein
LEDLDLNRKNVKYISKKHGVRGGLAGIETSGPVKDGEILD